MGMDREMHDEVMIPQKVKSLHGQLRRNSTGIMAAPNLQPPILSRYLRASVGSCHDMCKYGRKHNSEAKTNYLRSRRKATIPRDRYNLSKISAQLEGNEKSLIKVDKSPKSVIVKRDESWSTQDGDVIVKKAAISGDLCDQDRTSDLSEGNEKSLIIVDESPKSVILKTDDSLLTQDGDVVVKKATSSGDLRDKDKTSASLEGKEKSLVNVDESSKTVILRTDDSLSTPDRDASLQAPEDPDVIVKKAAISGDLCDQDRTSDLSEGNEKSLIIVDESPKSVILKTDDSLLTQDGDVVVKKATSSGDLRDQDKTSASLEGKEKSLVNVDESSKTVILRTDDSLSTPDRDVSLQAPEDPDVTEDFAANLKENSVHPSPSTHAKGGTDDEVHNKTGRAFSAATRKSSSSRKNQKIRSAKATWVSVNEKEKILPSMASIAPECSSSRGSNREARNHKKAQLASNQKDCSISKAEPKLSNCEDKIEKRSAFAVADVGNKMAGTAENSLHTLHESPKAEKERWSSGKITSQLPPSSEKKKLRRAVSACGLAKLPLSSDKKNLRRIVRPVNRSPSSSSLLLTSSLTTSKSTNGDTPSVHEAAVKGNPEARSNTIRPKRVSTDSSDVTKCQPQNLPFRRGKVVEPRLENVPPRKLRFRRPGLLGETQIGKGDAGRKIFRRKDIDSLECKSIKSEKIVLKHRHVEKREKVRSLFNNVIEETASKLVETRKSKVKALVGAFETVISLQDTKPKATVIAC